MMNEALLRNMEILKKNREFLERFEKGDLEERIKICEEYIKENKIEDGPDENIISKRPDDRVREYGSQVIYCLSRDSRENERMNISYKNQIMHDMVDAILKDNMVEFINGTDLLSNKCMIKARIKVVLPGEKQ